MFPKTLYAQSFEDGSLFTTDSKTNLLEVSEDGELFAVYQLVETGTVKESKRLVMDKPLQEKHARK